MKSVQAVPLLSFLSQWLMYPTDAGGQILMSGMTSHRLSGRLHEIQNQSRPAAAKVIMPADMPSGAPIENEPHRESIEQPGNTVIDMGSLKAEYSQDSISLPKSQRASLKPAMATASEEVVEGNAGASSAWLLAARSFTSKHQQTSVGARYANAPYGNACTYP